MNAGSPRPAAQIRSFFSSIAHRYDLANHLLSGGCDFFWRRRAAREISKLRPRRILDLATGSGDLAVLLGKFCPGSCVVGADFCLPMLEIARRKGASVLVAADGLKLPFASTSFGAVTVAFGFRNMASWHDALIEIGRVLEPKGTLLILDFSMPAGIFRKPYQLYLHHILPRLARILTGEQSAYEYLGDSIEHFPQGAEMERVLSAANFKPTKQSRLAGGVVSIYMATTAVESAPGTSGSA
jgi:demethylmenaquinone methyltransferase / 2-methoxy-6-polyprenyl-1,4-benzoquinol methylase